MKTTIRWWFFLIVCVCVIAPASAIINVTAEAVGETWVTWVWDEGVNVTAIYVDGQKMCGYESTMPTFDMLDLKSCQFHNVSIFSETDYGTNITTTRCEAAPGGLTGGETTKPPVIPIETTNLFTPFVLAPLLCLAYLFRAVKSDENDEQNEESNPIWGDIIVSGAGFIISAMVAIWFIQGISSTPAVIESVSYTLSASDSSVGDIRTFLADTKVSEYQITPGGTGMFLRSSITSSEITMSGSSVIVHTHDSVRQLYQDTGVMLLYMLLCAVLGLMFVWSLLEARRQIQERDYYDENDMEQYGG